MRGEETDGESREVKEGNLYTERLKVVERKGERVQNKQRKVWINQREGGAAGAKQKAEQYIFSLWREAN